MVAGSPSPLSFVLSTLLALLSPSSSRFRMLRWVYPLQCARAAPSRQRRVCLASRPESLLSFAEAFVALVRPSVPSAPATRYLRASTRPSSCAPLPASRRHALTSSALSSSARPARFSLPLLGSARFVRQGRRCAAAATALYASEKPDSSKPGSEAHDRTSATRAR